MQEQLQTFLAADLYKQNLFQLTSKTLLRPILLFILYGFHRPLEMPVFLGLYCLFFMQEQRHISTEDL